MSGLLAVFCFLTLSVTALAGPTKFDIPAQAAPDALQLFIKQSGTQVMFVADELKAVTTNAVTGEHEPAAALSLLLQGTGYTSAERKSGWFTVVRAVVEKPGSIEGVVRAADSGRGVPGARVEIAGTDKFVFTDKRGRFVFEAAPIGDQELHITAEGMQNTKVTDVTVKPGHRHTLSSINIPAKTPGVVQLDTFVVSAKKNDGVVELDPFSVEGQREKPFTTANVDIPRTINDAQPYYIFDAKTIDRSGAANVEDLLKKQLTMNATALTNGQIGGGGLNVLGNISSIDLRGLGSTQTLVLVNGRRMAGVSIAGIDYQPDLNGIPLSAIERVEVLPTSASGIYGGSALGGVVNVILKRNYAGGEIRATYDNTWDSDAASANLTATYGMSLEGGRTHLMLTGSWSDGHELLLQDRRDLFERGLAIYQKNSPSSFFTTATPFLGALPNIVPSSSTATTLILKDGRSLGSRNTYIAPGTSITTSMAALSNSLFANAGQWNMDLPASTMSPTGLLRPIGVTPASRSMQASVRRQMWTNLEAFAEFAYSSNYTDSVYNPYSTASTLTVPITAPSNPFTTAVRLRVPLALNVPLKTNSLTRSISVGLQAKLPFDWTGQFDYSRSENRFSYRYSDVDTVARGADVANGMLNPFVDTLLNPPNFEKYLYSTSYRGSATLQSFALRGSGPLWKFTWGTPQLTLGIEHRIAKTPQNVSEQDHPITPQDNLRTTYYPREQTTDSGYGELEVPVGKALVLQLSGRGERYNVDTGTPYVSTFYNLNPPFILFGTPMLNGQPFFSETSYTSTNYTTGFKYRFPAGFTLRASQATAFLPPTPGQLLKNPVPNTGTTTITDPKNSNSSVQVQTISGGNPDLKPQNSNSQNVGIVWEPQSRGLDGLRLNVEYYRIDQTDAIGALSAQQIVNQEDNFGGRVTRNTAGAITLVDVSAVNLFRRETEGWDFSVDYAIKTSAGAFKLRAVKSKIRSLKNQYSVALPAYEAAGFHPTEGGAAKGRTNATIAWEYRRWSAAWSVRHVSAYKQYGASGGPNSTQFANGGVFGTSVAAQGSDTIPSQTYHDLFLSCSFGEASTRSSPVRVSFARRMFSGLTMQLGIRNLFETLPPFDVRYDNNFYISPYGDTRLRSYWLTVKKEF